MSDLSQNPKAEIKNDTAAVKRSLEQLRDEIRVRIHLGGMDLRDTFEKLEREADHLVAQVPPAARRHDPVRRRLPPASPLAASRICRS